MDISDQVREKFIPEGSSASQLRKQYYEKALELALDDNNPTADRDLVLLKLGRIYDPTIEGISNAKEDKTFNEVEGMDKDLAKARELYQKAEELGDPAIKSRAQEYIDHLHH